MRSFLAASRGFREGTDSPRAFLERCIVVIAEKERQIGAFVTINLTNAREAADKASERWRLGQPLSLVDGMPIGIKDILETADMPTEQGSPLFIGWRGGRDSAAVAALREAGAVIVGKTVTTEFASTEPRQTRNPCDLARTPGGSSSGSAAAVGAGMVPGALGSQVIGSTIRPASFCGCFGFKPSVGGINRGGSFDVFSQSCVGVFGATLGETWTIARAISARAGGDPGYTGLSGPLDQPAPATPSRITVLETAGWGCDTEEARRATLEVRELRCGRPGAAGGSSGATEEAKMALREAVDRMRTAGIEVIDRKSHKMVADVEAAIMGAFKLSLRINAWEGRWPLNTYARDMDRSQLSQGSLGRLAQAESMTLEEYQGLIDERRRIRDSYAALQSHCDICVTLAAPGPAPVGLNWTGDPTFAVPASLLGTPALSLPALRTEGLPLGLQLIGFANRDESAFAAAAAIIQVLQGGRLRS